MVECTYLEYVTKKVRGGEPIKTLENRGTQTYVEAKSRLDFCWGLAFRHASREQLKAHKLQFRVIKGPGELEPEVTENMFKDGTVYIS